MLPNVAQASPGLASGVQATPNPWAVFPSGKFYILSSRNNCKGYEVIFRVATAREKVLENEKFSRSAKSQGTTFSVREI